MRTIRRKMDVIKNAAAPGPSSVRNELIKAVGTIRDGVATLQRWCAMWARAGVCSETTELWAAAKIGAH